MKIRSSNLFAVLFASAALLGAASHASAQSHEHGHGNHAAADASALSSGEVKKVDKSNAKLTIKHGPLANLNMPEMTMTFKVKDPAMLENFNAGDRIRFRVERVNGSLTVTHLETHK